MIVSTFEDDLFGLKDFADRLDEFIKIEHRYVEGSLVIALSSKYGSGKTTFLQMWKSSREGEGEQEGKPLMVMLNAWESDYYGDPLFAIISSLISSFEGKGESDDKVKNVIEAAKDFGWFTTAIAGQFAKKVTGVDAIAAGKHAESKKAERQDKSELFPDSFSVFEGRKKAMSSLKKAIQELVQATDNGILFLVDELDRCRPDYAISYLETIKHIFDIKGATFLLAADRVQLKNSAKKAFGADLDFDEYYRKFIHREVTLPEISEANYEKLVLEYVSFYLEVDDVRNCSLELDNNASEKYS